MALTSLANIEKTFGRRIIFDQLHLQIDQGERIGLIGDNGSGKTTLLKMLAGQIQADAGLVTIAKNVRMSLLDQDPVFDDENTVMDEAELAFAELHRLSHHLREQEHEMADVSGQALEKLLAQYQHLQHEFDLAGGHAWRHRLEAVLQGVGLEPAAWGQNVGSLSGGQRSRLALAKMLLSEPDLLLLDEPTNHLDLAAIEWLEDFLLDFRGATLLISHDRYLLDRLATRIVYLKNARLASYPGNYSAFVKQREVHELTQARAYAEQQEDIEKQSEYIRRFSAGQRARQAKGRKKRLLRLLESDQLIHDVSAQRKIHLALRTDQRAGDIVLRTSGLAKSYGENTLWRDVALEVRRGQRIGVVGPNGSGKTTLLEVLIARREPDQGEIFWGANLRIGYYDQNLDDFDPTGTVIEEARGQRRIPDQELRSVLATMLFGAQDMDKPVGLLSGGERARLSLSQLLLDKPNVLVLDEPTNHLDIASREALEAALGQFPGTFICVSHDRYFLDRVVNRLWVIEPPGLADFSGNYSAWIARQRQRQTQAKAAAELAKNQARLAQAPKAATPSADNPYKRPFGRLSLEELERRITDTEIALAQCQREFADASTFKDPSRGRQLRSDYDELNKTLAQLEAEYFARQ